MLLYDEELYDGIKDICLTCWVDVLNVYYGIPRIEITTYPHVVIRLASVPSEAIIGTIEQVYTFEIIYRGEWSTASTFNIELAKIARANEFIAALTQSTTLATYGLMPTVTDVDFIEADDPNEPYYEVVLTLAVVVHSEYGA